MELGVGCPMDWRSYYTGRSWINGNVGLACLKGVKDQDVRLHPARGKWSTGIVPTRVRGVRGCPFVAHGEAVDLDSTT
jgi:hypothetical protein